MEYESDVERHLVRCIRELGGEAIKMSAGEGWPDRLCILPSGRIIWVETKRIGGRPSGMQMWRHRQLRALGQRVEMPYTKEEVDRILTEKAGAD